jgi:hypothetical protein
MLNSFILRIRTFIVDVKMFINDYFLREFKSL